MIDQNDQPGDSAGLLDNVTVEDDNTPTNDQSSGIDHRAADTTEAGKIPGAPIERPEWLPTNFWDEEKGEANYEAMAKSWGDMRKMVSQGKHKAPEGGKYDTDALPEGFDEQPLIDLAAKYGLPQAAFDDLAKQLTAQVSTVEIDTEAEVKALGPNATAIINSMVDWARGQVNKGVWGHDDFEEFKIMGGTAKGMRTLMKLRESYEGRLPIESEPLDGAPSMEELYQMVGKPEYNTDPVYQKKVASLFFKHVK